MTKQDRLLFTPYEKWVSTVVFLNISKSGLESQSKDFNSKVFCNKLFECQLYIKINYCCLEAMT